MRGRDRHRRREAASTTPVPLMLAALVTNLFAGSVAGAPFTFARASTAYVQDFEGVERLCLAGEARFWGARRVRNLFTKTEDFSDAIWAKLFVANSIYNQPGPDGRLIATKLIVDNGVSVVGNDGNGAFGQTVGSVTRVGNSITVSVLAKAAEATVLRIREGVTSGRRAVFDLVAGTIAYENAATIANFPAAMRPVGGGWWLCYVTYVSANVTTNFGFKGSGAAGATVGDGVSGLFLASPQEEDVTGQSVQTPSERVSNGALAAPYHGVGNSVDGVKCFDTVRLHAQNLMTYSSTASNPIWVPTDGAISADSDVTPLGRGAWSYADNAVNSAHRVAQLISNVGPVQFNTFELVGYVKAGTRNQCALRLTDQAFTQSTRIQITDINAMTFTRADTGAPLNSSVSITDAGNGWRKCVVRLTFTGAPTENGQLYALLYSDATTGAYVGTGQTVLFGDWSVRRVSSSILDAYVETQATPITLDSGRTAPISANVLKRYFREPAGTQLVTPTASIRNLSDAAWVASGGASTATLTATGVDGSPNAATRFTATGANAVRMQAALVLAGANRVFSCYMRRIAGAGVVNMTGDGGVTWQAVAVPAQWGRVGVLTAVANPQIGFRIVTANDAIDVDFTQFEPVSTGMAPDGSAYTSPMSTSGTNVRAKDTLTYPIAGNVDGTIGGALLTAFPYTARANTSGFLDGNPNELVASANLGARGWMRDGTTTLQTTGGAAWAGGAAKKFASAWGGGTMSIACTGGTLGTGAFDGNMNPVLLRIGENGSTTAEMVGSIGDVAIYNVKPTDAQLNSWVA